MSRRRKNAGAGYGFMFSGAFSDKKDAVKKEKQRKGSFVKGIPTAHGYRYVVMTPRTNPRRRQRNPTEKRISLKEFRKLLREHGYGPGAAVRGATRLQADEMIRRLDENARKYSAQSNPMDLVVMGANPQNPHYGECRGCGQRHNLVGGYCQNCRPDLWRAYHGHNPATEVVAHPGDTIHIRVNPTTPAPNSLGTLLGWAPSAPARAPRKARKKERPPRWLGWGPSKPASKQERAGRRRTWQAGIRREKKRTGEQYRRWRRSARASYKGKKKLEGLFHELYGRENPICGASVQGYPCTRQPGHRGPHLPQGATLRPWSRHNWGARGNPCAESIREEFTGAPVDRVDTYREGHMPAGNYALLGKLLMLYVKPRAGGQVMMIKGGAGVQIVSDESARQIWFVGGDQDISQALTQFGAVDRGAGLLELGEARRIDYKQRKEHVPKPDFDEWQHHFGEETGERPTVLFDANHKRLLLEGGAYRVTADGIIN